MTNNESTAQLVSNANGYHDSLRKDNSTANAGNQGQTSVTSSWQKSRNKQALVTSCFRIFREYTFSICDLDFSTQTPNIMQLKMRKVLCPPNKTGAESEIIQIGNSLQPTWSIYALCSATQMECWDIKHFYN